MATLLESLSFFDDIMYFFLPFLLVFAILFAVLTKSKYLSESANVNAAIAFAIAFLVALSGAGKFIATIAPMFTVLFIILFLLFLIFLFFGMDVKKVMEHRTSISILIIIIGIIFVFYAIGTLYGSSFYGSSSTGAAATNATKPPIGYETCDFTTSMGGNAFACLLGHPRVLGAIVLLGVMIVATFFIMYVPKD